MAQIQQFAPINYAGMQPIQDPNAGFMRGLQMVQAFQQMDADAEARKLQVAKMAAETAKAQAEAERRAAYQSDIASAFENPSHEAFAALTAKHPDQREALSQSWKMLSGAQQDSEFLTGAQAFNALQSGNAETAKSVLEAQITAMKNGGKDASKLEAMRSTIDVDPKRAQAQLGFVLSAVDPERWAKMGAESRASDLAPSKLAESEATATIKGIEAQFAPDKMAEDLKKQRADLVKTMADTANTDANRRKTLAEIAALDAKAKMLAEGKIPPEDRPAMEIKLNDKFLKDTANFTEVQEGYRRVKGASPNEAGDLSLVFGYMKMLDPTSTVREGEQAQVRNAAGVPDRIKNQYNKLMSGEILTKDQRIIFKAEAEKLLQAAQIKEKKVRAGMEEIVKNYGLNPENVFYYRNSADSAPKDPAQASPSIMSAQTGLPVARDATTAKQSVKTGEW